MFEKREPVALKLGPVARVGLWEMIQFLCLKYTVGLNIITTLQYGADKHRPAENPRELWKQHTRGSEC